MKKDYAIVIAILITILIAMNSYFLSSRPQKRESVKIERIIDGDTLELEDGRIIRLLNINTPEKNELYSSLSKDFMQQFVNQTLEIEITGNDKYRRNLARVYSPDYINLEIVRDGFANKFLVDDSELNLFSTAEEIAIKESRGMWKKSQYAECIITNIDEKSEIVTLSNSCPSLNIESWRIKDESRKYYKFPGINLTTLKIHSGYGRNNATDIFIKSPTPIWNNDRDSLYLFDSEGNLVHHEIYGY
ncbi:thermonuclease family protein [Candidatus Pacearchaeota archaeon]|nr:thermonuclease family protein [Candidatus Pacearchaeota archaeon]